MKLLVRAAPAEAERQEQRQRAQRQRQRQLQRQRQRQRLRTPSTEAELRQALAAGGPETVVLTAGSRIELTGDQLTITRTVRLVGEAGGALPAIAGAVGEEALVIIGAGVSVELEGLRIEGRSESSRGGNAIVCQQGSSLLAVRCEVAGNRVCFDDKGTSGELRECAIVGSTGHMGDGLAVFNGASVVMDGGAVRGCAGIGVAVVMAGSRVAVRCPTPPSFPSSFGFDSYFSPVSFGRFF
eukprot:COSAG06_NODE_4209_length_4473_cov_275.412730_4_plen_240_part_00